MNEFTAAASRAPDDARGGRTCFLFFAKSYERSVRRVPYADSLGKNSGSSASLLAIAYGVDEVRRRFSVAAVTAATSGGVLLYAGTGLVCLLLGANYLDYAVLPLPDARSTGMLIIEIGVGITVMAAMVSIFLDLITFE